MDIVFVNQNSKAIYDELGKLPLIYSSARYHVIAGLQCFKRGWCQYEMALGYGKSLDLIGGFESRKMCNIMMNNVLKEAMKNWGDNHSIRFKSASEITPTMLPMTIDFESEPFLSKISQLRHENLPAVIELAKEWIDLNNAKFTVESDRESVVQTAVATFKERQMVGLSSLVNFEDTFIPLFENASLARLALLLFNYLFTSEKLPNKEEYVRWIEAPFSVEKIQSKEFAEYVKKLPLPKTRNAKVVFGKKQQ